jgi:hypothetical protein
MKVRLKNVLPNPFRDMDRYPINRQKVETLKKSIGSTTFWDNIVARKSGRFGVEIAYGHHRLVALRELFDDDHQLEFIVRDLSDKEMLQIMANENLQEWGHDAAVERETVRAVVEAYAEDRIALPEPPRDTPHDKLRFAPGFCFGINDISRRSTNSVKRPKPYTGDAIIGFLGGTLGNNAVQYALRALCLIEQGHLTEAQLTGMTSSEARVIVDETNRAIKHAESIRKDAEREAKRAATPTQEKMVKREAEKKARAVVKTTARTVSTAIQKGEGAKAAKAAGTQARVKAAGKVDQEMPEINKAADRVAAQIARLLDPEHSPGEKLEELIKFKRHLSPTSLQNLDRALEVAIEWAEGYRTRLS